jgi:hypothetical protein
MLRHEGERRGCGAHPGVLSDEEETAEKFADDEEERWPG